jgi:hypothetical protein
VTIIHYRSSCQQKESIEPVLEISPKVKKIKEYFYEHIYNCNPQGSAARENNNNIRYAIKELNWYEAQFNEYSNGTALYIPLEYEEEIRAPKGDGSISYDHLSYVLVTPGQEGINVELVISYPDLDYQQSTDPNIPFSGIVEVTDWYGNLKHQFVHRNDSVFEVTGYQSNVASLECVTTINCFGTITTYEGGYSIIYHCGPYKVCTVGSIPTYQYTGYSDSDPYSGGGGTGVDGDKNEPKESIDDTCGPNDTGNEGCVEFLIEPYIGDSVSNPVIAPQTNSKIEGGMYGCARGGTGCPTDPTKHKDHEGIDIKNE